MLKHNQKKWKLVSDDLRALLEIVDPEPKSYPDELIHKYMSNLYYIPGYNPNKGAINFIVTSGKIALIENEELQYKLNVWPTAIAEYNFAYGIIRDMVYDFQKSFRKYHQFKDSEKNINPNKEPLGSSRFPYDQKILLSLPDLESAVEMKRVDSDGLELAIVDLLNLQQGILNLVEAELTKR